MIKYLLFIHFFALAPLVQTDGCDRHVVRIYEDGSPHVVVYIKPPSNNRIKEEIYFENGQKDYEGYYRNGVEHGKWTYWWPNGNLKSEETYIRGKEDGVMYDYDETGNKITEFRYSKGVLIEEVPF